MKNKNPKYVLRIGTMLQDRYRVDDVLDSNGMTITSFDKHKKILFTQTYYSIGGGFVITQDEIDWMEQDKQE